ncbi:u1 small nuclear ribonucleo protein [Rutstroemia sp. NJR-2017a BVV2]|nr:u1 small nuclear ribonucleo protein [Rutstroemia sp. NJR-2017a BVV2]
MRSQKAWNYTIVTMTDKLPPNLLALFAPRPPLRWAAPSDHAPEQRKTPHISGLAAYLPALQEYKETDVYVPTESWLQRKDRVKQEKKAAHEKLIKEAPVLFKPHEDPNIRGDAFKTLIVSRLDYQAKEKDLEREFGRFGPIERIRIVTDTHQHEKPKKKAKPHRGYAFVVFEREKDMRVKVDVERGRTVKGWLPRRFGGGLGGRGYTKAIPPRPMGPGGFGGPPGGPGGFRGGFRGGFDGGRGRGGFRGGFDRGGYGGGRGGIGYQGGGGFGNRGERGGGSSNGYAPPNAPAGPGGGGRGGFGGGGYGRGGGGFGGPDRNGSGPPAGGYDSRGGRSYDDRSGGYRANGNRGYGDRDGGPPRGGSGSNMEPVRPRDGYRDRDRDGGYGSRPREDDSRKRPYENSNGYEEDPRKLRRY